MAALGMCGTVFGVDGEREGRRGGVGDGFHGGSLEDGNSSTCLPCVLEEEEQPKTEPPWPDQQEQELGGS
ncbi:hypothetical protein NC651_028132 [Populus alba x Populus x berolinensis]|nr:hypothetical protein NC651_028132 [Populus alba x Populus x berolinensis]